MSLRDQGSMEGLQFTNITIESLFYERIWLGGAEPIHITAMPRAVNVEVGCPDPFPHLSTACTCNCHAQVCQRQRLFSLVPALQHLHASAHDGAYSLMPDVQT